MHGVNLLSAGILIGMSAIHDLNSTVGLVAATISVRGITWIATKVTGSVSPTNSQMIDLAGWCIAGVSIVGLISNAMCATSEVMDFLGTITGGFRAMATFFEKMAEIADKIVFWN